MYVYKLGESGNGGCVARVTTVDHSLPGRTGALPGDTAEHAGSGREGETHVSHAGHPLPGAR